MRDNREKLECVFQIGSVQEKEIFSQIFERLRETQEFPIFKSKGKDKTGYEILRDLGDSAGWGASISSGGLIFRYAEVSLFKISLLQIEEEVPNACGGWDVWVSSFLSAAGFIQAWISDCEFDYWQNAEDLEIYRLAGKDIMPLPLKDNGLPAPLKQKMVDISGNPGRRILRPFYIEVIGSKMWLSKFFWMETGGFDQTILTKSGWSVSISNNDVVVLQASESTFKIHDSSDHLGALRKAIYR